MVALTCLFAACGDTGSDFFPLTKQRQWNYALTMTVLEETYRSDFPVRALGETRYEGKVVSIIEYANNTRGYYSSPADGVRRLATMSGIDASVRLDSDEHYILKSPLTVGTTWILPSKLTLAESVFFLAGERIRDREVPVTLQYTIAGTNETVTVPAGTYSNCLKVTATGSANVRVNQGANFGHVDVQHTDWYAPGVGLVKSERRESSESPYLKTGSYLQELVTTQ